MVKARSSQHHTRLPIASTFCFFLPAKLRLTSIESRALYYRRLHAKFSLKTSFPDKALWTSDRNTSTSTSIPPTNRFRTVMTSRPSYFSQRKFCSHCNSETQQWEFLFEGACFTIESDSTTTTQYCRSSSREAKTTLTKSGHECAQCEVQPITATG